MKRNGTVLNDRYRVVRELGKGAQGGVYEVSDELGPKEHIALKILERGVPSSMLRFEFEQLARLEHPHLVRVYDLGTIVNTSGPAICEKGALFFTQELVSGDPAHMWSKQIPSDELASGVAKVGVAVARALSMLHGSGLLHLDVKPSNVLVGNVSIVKLIDLGLSRYTGALDVSRAGTLGFLAPEILSGVPDERSDLYALGATLSHMLTGTEPVYGKPLPGSRPSNIPLKLWNVLARITADDPMDRFQTAKDTVLAIGRAMGAEILGGSDSLTIDAVSETESKETLASRMRSPTVIGRQEELLAIKKWLNDLFISQKGTTAVGVITGPSGVGKTRLFRQAMVDFQIASTQEGNSPPILLKGTIREIESLLPLVSQPTVFLVEDGDAELTSLILAELQNKNETAKSLAIGMVAEMRDGDRARRLADINEDAEGGFLFVDLMPLDLETESLMVGSILRTDPSQRFMTELHRATGGLPLLTEAVLAELRTDTLDEKLGLRRLKELNLRSDSGEVVAEGLLAYLDGPARSLAEALAIVGRPVNLDEIAEITDLDNKVALEATSMLNRRGWLERDFSGRIELPLLVAGCLVASLPNLRKKNLCARALETIKKSGSGDFVELSRLADGAQKTKEAAALAQKAAKALLLSGDFRGAAKQLELVVTSGSSSNIDETKVALTNIHRRTGNYSRAIELALEVEQGSGKLAQRAALERAAVLRLGGEVDEALSVLVGLTKSKSKDISLEARALAGRIELDRGELQAAKKRIGEVPLEPDLDSMRSGVFSTAGLVELSLGESSRAQAFFEAGLDAAIGDRDDRNKAKYHGLVGISFHHMGDFQSAFEHYLHALEFAKSTGDKHGAATYTVNLAAACTELDKIEDALGYYRDGISKLRGVGRLGELAQAEANYAQLLIRIGDVESADDASRKASDDLTRSAQDPVVSTFVFQVRGDVLMSLHKNDEARSILLDALIVADDASSVACLELLCALELSEGNVDEARSFLHKIDSAGAQPSDVSVLERCRLELELSMLGSGDIKSSLDTLQGKLRAEVEQRRLVHLKAFASAARAASALGLKQQAREAAEATLGIMSVFEQAVPSLHKQTKTNQKSEMNEILGSLSSENMKDEQQGTKVTSKEWQYLIRINNRLNSELRIGRLFEYIMDTAIDITGAERGFLLIVDPEGELHIRCARNISQDTLQPGEHGYSRSVAQRSVEMNEPVLTTDAQEDPRFQSMRSVLNLNLRYIAAVPLQIKGQNTGAIYLDSRGGAQFDEGRVALLRALADQAAIALTNARLTAENKNRQASIERLNQKLKKELESQTGELKKVKGELAKRTDELITRYRYKEIVARSEAMDKVFALLDKVVDSTLPVVVEGDSGTGKELVARALHFNGPRKRRPFVAENCGAIPEGLLESVLFGHVKGAYTGAVSDNQGLFSQAHGGTLFLDEVSSMPSSMQVKLLRVLQDGEVRPVGGGQSTKVDVRIVVASNADLSSMVKDGVFREDLFYRLSVVTLKLPPLKERAEDIPLLVEHFTKKHSDDKAVKIKKEAMEALMDYCWPGNVRQLENEIMRATVLSGDVIEMKHLSDEVVTGIRGISASMSDFDMNRQVERLKRRMIEAALSNTGGNQSSAAGLLGISRFGLQKMMARFEIILK